MLSQTAPRYPSVKAFRRAQRPLKRYARAIYDLQVRADIAGRVANGESFEEIAEALGIKTWQVQNYYKQSEKRYQQVVDQIRFRGGTGYVTDYTEATVTASGSVILPVIVTSGTVIDSPEREYLKREILELRKRALPYAVISEQLGISVEEAKVLGKQAIMALGGDELVDVELAKRMQIEQIDAMISGIYVQATNGIYEAIDRMVKLLDAKAKLLGLNAPTRIDIDSRLVVMAEHLGADINELREIADEVIQDYPKLRGR